MPVSILGIETSCDETAAAVVEQGARVLSSVVASQISTHQPYGGIVPELASREHLRAIVPIVQQALEEAGAGFDGLQAVAATQGPGLVGSLLVGLTYAKALSLSLHLPLIGVNHLEGHVHAVLLQQRLEGAPEVELPALALVVSGGHTLTARVEADGVRFRYQVLGRTRDDAAGEAFDKVAKLLALGYPGGPVMDRLARHGNPQAVRFTPPKIKGNPLDFSFSGIKTAVLRYVEGQDMGEEIARRRALLAEQPRARAEALRELSSRATLDLVASFQHAVVEQLVARTLAAAREQDVRSVLVTGGVACNSLLRARFRQLPPGEQLPVFFPSPALSTDNAVMIAAAAYPKFLAQDFAGLDLPADPGLPLDGSWPAIE